MNNYLFSAFLFISNPEVVNLHYKQMYLLAKRYGRTSGSNQTKLFRIFSQIYKF